MFNLYQIVTGAQGGQALDNLAQQFGLSREQVDGAVQALMPALSTAFMAKAAQPGGLNDLAGAMTDDQHKQAYVDPGAAQDPDTQQKGAEVAGSIFGNSAILGQVVRQAAQYTGLPEATLQAMLPVVTSLVVGGVSTAMHNQGLGGMLGELSRGGLSSILGQFGGAAGPGNQSQPGGFPGMIGNIFQSFLGGGLATPQAPGFQAGAAGQANPAGALPPIMQAGMDALFKMFQPGVAATGGQADDLGDKINASFNDRR